MSVCKTIFTNLNLLNINAADITNNLIKYLRGHSESWMGSRSLSNLNVDVIKLYDASFLSQEFSNNESFDWQSIKISCVMAPAEVMIKRSFPVKCGKWTIKDRVKRLGRWLETQNRMRRKDEIVFLFSPFTPFCYILSVDTGMTSILIEYDWCDHVWLFNKTLLSLFSCLFSPPLLTDGLSLKSKWQQVLASPQDSSKYSSWN